MKIEHGTFQSRETGTEIHRIRAVGQSCDRGTVLAVHGLGDHILCHVKAIELFCRCGYSVEGFDWPGNGSSPGTRGDLPGVGAAGDLLGEFIDLLDDQPVGFYAHSTGGFISLPFIAGNQEHLGLDWLWLSSPLLRPTHNQPAWKISFARFLERSLPNFTVPTGVKAVDCYHTDQVDEKRRAEYDRGCHSRVSVRFANDLIRWEDRVIRAAVELRDPLEVLITQGSDDRVCPPEFARELFSSIPVEKKTFLSLEGLLHEPLREPDNQWFIASVESWLMDRPQRAGKPRSVEAKQN
jgi:alpha-beta hydrolase superfamily lysophospholipase